MHYFNNHSNENLLKVVKEKYTIKNYYLISKRTFIFFLFFLVFLIFQNVTFAQYTWTRILTQPRFDAGWSAMQTIDGNFVIVGEKLVNHAYDGSTLLQTYLAKLSPDGNILWQRTFGDSLFGNFSYSAAEDLNGNLFIASNWSTPRLIKTGPSGNIIWKKNLGNPIVEFGGIKLIDNNSNIIINEAILNSNSIITVGLSKLDVRGNLIWTKTYTDTSKYESNYNSFIITEDAYYIAGRKNISSVSLGVILKIDTAGNLLWEALNIGIGSYSSVCQNSQYSLIVLGTKDTNNGSWVYLRMINMGGNILWEKTYVSDSLRGGANIIKVNNNKFLLTCGSNDFKRKLVFIDTLGYIISSSTHYNAPNDNVVYTAINNSNDSGFIISGYIEPNESGQYAVLAVKTDKFGNTIPLSITNNNEIIKDFRIDIKAFPNPFNSSTIIQMNFTKSVFVKLRLYNIEGKEISEIYSGNNESGIKKFIFSPDNYHLASGIYFINLEAVSKNGYINKSYKIAYIK
jgi:hypothetical protein